MTQGEDPWFIAKDVCAVLEIKDHNQSTRHLDEDEKGMSIIQTPGGSQRVSIINESGLYALIL
ncbi:MAG: Bro-N domain-containing protein, partial [Desulfobulbaceae bacterium]|nr:Bro-N domain-containing protein [Desulfobulbaceae bacterium]